MKKRINLFNPVSNKRSFNAKSLAGSTTLLGITVSVTLLIGLALMVYVSIQKDQLSELQVLKSQLDTKVLSEQARFTQATVHPEITAEQLRVNKELSALKELKQLLQYIQPGQTLSFSKFLYSLAEASKPESWLNSFHLNALDKRFVFQGGANTANAVPVMLEAIVQTETFKGTEISNLVVISDDEKVTFEAQAELGSYE